MTRALPFLAAALAGAALLALVGVLRGPAEPEPTARYTSPDRGFTIATPEGWRTVTAQAGGAVLQREDERGLVVIRRRGPVREAYPALARKLTRSLRRELGAIKPMGARVAPMGTGTGLVYTFVHPKGDRVQSIVVAPAGQRAYTLDLVAPGDAPDVARELGTMVRSFAPRAQA